MIIVSMGGGLGNQMYEFAFYTKLKRIYPGEIIKIDSEYAFPYVHNGIELFSIFGLSAPKASYDEVLALTRGHQLYGHRFEKKEIVRKIYNKIKKKPDSMLVQSDNTVYDKKYFELDMNKSYYLFGVFANYHYFYDIEKEICGMFSFPEVNESRNIEYEKKIHNSLSVSVHVRGGDYIQAGIEMTSTDYYNMAIRMMEEHIGKASYYIFTDDQDYARKILPQNENYIFVEGNTGSKSFRDMQLMSMCKHNITANSTFSFWGAFLNRNKEKVIISPNLPYTGLKNPFVCDEWILI